MNSTTSKKLTNRLLSIKLFFPNFYSRIRFKGGGQKTAEGSKEFLNHTYEVKGKVLFRDVPKASFCLYFS